MIRLVSFLDLLKITINLPLRLVDPFLDLQGGKSGTPESASELSSLKCVTLNLNKLLFENWLKSKFLYFCKFGNLCEYLIFANL